MSQAQEARTQRAIASALSRDLNGTFERFVRTYQDRIYAFAVSLSKNATLAEELAQDTFVRAYKALQTYDAQRIAALSLRAWLYQITLNLVRNSTRRKRVETLELERASHIAVPGTLEDDALRREAARTVHSLVTALPPAFRTAVVLHHLDDLTYDEIARITAQPVGTIKSNVHRGLAMLRKELAHAERP